MTELLDTITRYWPVFAFLTGGVFSLGMLFVKVQMSINGTAKLFKVTDDLVEFKRDQIKDHEHLKERFQEYIEKFDKHHDLDAERHTNMETQLNNIFQAIGSLKAGK